MKVRTAFWSVSLLLTLYLSACARTDITEVWIKDDFTGPAFQSILVLAQTGEKYDRSNWENLLTDRFRQNSVKALPAVSIFPKTGMAGIDKVISHASRNGIDGVLVVRYIATRTEKRFHPPEINYYYSWMDYYPLRREYHPGYGRRFHSHPYYRHYPYYSPYFLYLNEVAVTPGYTSYHTAVHVESYLYAAISGEQVWSMTSVTYDPRSADHLVADLSRSIFKTLRKYDLVALTR